jgi:hypothetical protein
MAARGAARGHHAVHGRRFHRHLRDGRHGERYRVDLRIRDVRVRHQRVGELRLRQIRVGCVRRLRDVRRCHHTDPLALLLKQQLRHLQQKRRRRRDRVAVDTQHDQVLSRLPQ